MDPLSVAASIVGLLAAGGKVTSLLLTLINKYQQPPKFARGIMLEVADISAALGHLQAFFTGSAEAGLERKNLIMIDQLLTTLTGCVTTYSELQVLLDSLNVSEDMGMFDRVKWMMQEDKLNIVLQRLQSHKSSMTLMLTIFQCKSMEEAQECTQRLCTLVEEMLESNRDLSQRIRGLERGGAIIAETQSEIAPSSDGRNRDNNVSISRHRRSTSTNTTTSADGNTSNLPSVIDLPRFTFDEALESSHVYGRAGYQFSQLSLTSAALYTTALSIFSKLSLGQVSNVPAYALPVFAVDLFRGGDGYVFGGEEDGEEEESGSAGERAVGKGTSGTGNLVGLVSMFVVPSLIIGGA